MTAWRSPARFAVLALGVVSAFTGCQGLADRDVRGPALLTIHGQISLAPGTEVDGNLRIALTWYPTAESASGGYPTDQSASGTSGGDGGTTCGSSTFLGIVSQDVEYRPSFPIDYAFDITAPPPSSVQGGIADIPGGVIAFGTIVAYVDANGNGRLDPCTPGKPCPDRLLGASGSFVSDDETAATPNTFLDFASVVASLGDGGASVGPGFFLERDPLDSSSSSELLPLPQTPVDIVLDDRPSVRAIVCTEICNQFLVGSCAVDDVMCTMPALPASPMCSTDVVDAQGRSRELVWNDVENCTVTTNKYIVDGMRDLPPWWPCK